MERRVIATATDSYKLNHWNQYPKDTEAVYSYFEARPGAKWPYTTFFGLQYLIKEYLAGIQTDEKKLERAYALSTAHFGSTKMFNYTGWLHIVNDHACRLPLRIKAVPEGMSVPNDNVLMTVENTCPDCFWLTNYVESMLCHLWYSCNVATLSRTTFEMIADFLDDTGSPRDGLPFMLHDFGYRGASSHETAAVGGAAHLVNGRGTDTVPGMELALDYYGADLETLAFSVPATEHSVMTARGEEGEFEVVEQLLAEYPSGILSVVCDSYDTHRFAAVLGTKFRDQVMARDGKFVVRPDSGDPSRTMVGLSQQLWAHFGGTENKAGYKELDPHVGLLWGDGIGADGIGEILGACANAGFAASNYVFGMGGGLLQKHNRDTQRFAFKASAVKRNGEWHNVQKKANGKTSKAGRLALVNTGLTATVATINERALTHPGDDILETVFENGELVRDMTFDEVRENARIR